MAKKDSLSNSDIQQLKELGLITEDTFNQMSSKMTPNTPQKSFEQIREESMTPELKQELTQEVQNMSTPNQQPTNFLPGYAQGSQPQPQQAQPTPQQTQENIQLATDIADQMTPQQQMQQQQMAAQQQIGLNTQQAYEIQQEAAFKAAQAQAAQAGAEAAQFRALQDEDERKIMESEARQAERTKQLLEQENKLQTAIEQFNSTPATVADRFADQSTVGKIATGLAIFLGAAGQGPRNAAVASMERAVEADINKAKDSMGNEKLLYNQMMERFNNQQQAEAATRMAYIANTELKLKEIAAQYKAPQVQANAEALFGQLEVAKQNAMMQFQQAVQVNPSIMQADQMTKQIMRLPKELRNKALEEKGIAEQLQTGMNNIGSAFDKINEIGTLSANIPFSEAKATVDAAKSSIMAAIQANWKGPMSDSDLKRIDGLLPVSTDTVAQNRARKAELLKVLETNSKATPILDGFGIKPRTFDKQPN